MAEVTDIPVDRLPEEKPKYKKVSSRGMVFAVITLVAFGLIMIYSTTYYSLSRTDTVMYSVFVKELLYALIGFAIMIVFSFFSYKKVVGYLRIPAYLVAFGFMFLTEFTSLGKSLNSSTRWLQIGPIRFQPSETVKLAMVIFIAGFLYKHKRDFGKRYAAFLPTKSRHGGFRLFVKRHFPNGLPFHKNFMILLILFLVPEIMVFKNNLSSGVILFLIYLVMIYLGSKLQTRRAKFGMYAVFALIPIAYFALFFFGNTLIPILQKIILKDYQAKRLVVWLNPEAYPSEGGWQVLRALYALGSGGLFGKGLGKSVIKRSISQADNDMIFSIICEELGIVGALFVIILYAYLIYRMYVIAKYARDSLGTLLVSGIMMHFALQVIVNIGVVCTLFPNTGAVLPFISNGGTALWINLLEIGIVLNVAKTSRIRIN